MEKINIFMDWIYNKPIYSTWFVQKTYYRKFKLFITDVFETVPDFITLCHIVNFIRLLKITYYYRFDKESDINTLDDIIIDDNNFGFILYKNGYNIEFKLNRPNHKISIRVIDTQQNKSHSEISKVEFIEGELKIESPIQKFQYGHLNRLVMESVARLLIYYYDYHTKDRYNGYLK